MKLHVFQLSASFIAIHSNLVDVDDVSIIQINQLGLTNESCVLASIYDQKFPEKLPFLWFGKKWQTPIYLRHPLPS